MGNFNRMSVATIDSPEFVNINSISPLVSKCEVKVLYVGENRNRSFITKEVAMGMAQTLPGCPIVGYFIDSKEDFGDHGDQVIIDGEGVKFKKLTKPYGFVAPDSKIWFQKFNDTDEFGNTVTREYLMTEGYLWTGQYEECRRVVEGGNPQSMELDEKSLKGYWSTNNNRGVDFFIINDAMFSKLCILGEDVEPCFEGADITAPKISSSFSKDNDFNKTLFTMIQELKDTLEKNKGGYSMETEKIVDTVVEEVSTQFEEESVVEDTPVTQFDEEGGDDSAASTPEGTTEGEDEGEEETGDAPLQSEEELANQLEAETSIPVSRVQKEQEQFAKCDEEDDKDEEKKEDNADSDKEEEEDEDKKKYQLELEELQSKYALLEAENASLREFKNSIENKEKDELIASFYMLSDEDKKDVIENKTQYSLDDIEAKLSVICVRKKVNFSVDSDNKEAAPVTFNLNAAAETVNLPAWLKAVEDVKKSL